MTNEKTTETKKPSESDKFMSGIFSLKFVKIAVLIVFGLGLIASFGMFIHALAGDFLGFQAWGAIISFVTVLALGSLMILGVIIAEKKK